MDKRRKKDRRKRRDQKVKARVRAAQLSQVGGLYAGGSEGRLAWLAGKWADFAGWLLFPGWRPSPGRLRFAACCAFTGQTTAADPASPPPPSSQQAEGIGEDNGPESLFSLDRIKGKGAASGLGDAAAPDFEGAGALASSSSGEEAGGGGSGSESVDSEDEQRR